MEIKQLQLVRRIPKEQYGYEEITALIDVDSDENPADALEAARVKLGISDQEAPESEEQEEQEEQEEEAPKKPSKKGSKKKEEEEEESEEEEDENSDEGDSEEDAESDDAEEGDEDEAAEEEEEEEKPKKTADKKGGKKFRQLGSPYDRNNDTHKNILSKFLKANHPAWAKKDEAARKKAQEISKKMQGEEFLDGEGHLKDSFTEKFMKQMPKATKAAGKKK